MVSGDSPLPSPRRCSSAGSGSAQWRFSASWKASAAPAAPGSSAAASASESCWPSSVSSTGSGGDGSPRSADESPKISGAAASPSTSLRRVRAHGRAVLGGRGDGRAHHVEGVESRGLVELDDARLGAIAAAGAQGLGLAARRPAGRGHALARVVGPLPQRRSREQQHAGHEAAPRRARPRRCDR